MNKHAEEWYEIAIREAAVILRCLDRKAAGSVMDAEDYAHEVLPKFLKCLQAGEIKKHHAAFLKAMIRNRIRDDLRKSGGRTQFEIGSPYLPVDKLAHADGIPVAQMRHDGPILIEKIAGLLRGECAAMFRFFARNALNPREPTDRAFAAFSLKKEFGAVKKTVQRFIDEARDAENCGLLDDPSCACPANVESLLVPGYTMREAISFLNLLGPKAGESMTIKLGNFDFSVLKRPAKLRAEDTYLLEGCTHLLKSRLLLEFFDHDDIRKRAGAVILTDGLASTGAAASVFRGLGRHSFLLLALFDWCNFCLGSLYFSLEGSLPCDVDLPAVIRELVAAYREISSIVEERRSADPSLHTIEDGYLDLRRTVLNLAVPPPRGYDVCMFRPQLNSPVTIEGPIRSNNSESC